MCECCEIKQKIKLGEEIVDAAGNALVGFSKDDGSVIVFIYGKALGKTGIVAFEECETHFNLTGVTINFCPMCGEKLNGGI